ncbi:MAG: hypothetical protein RLZZ71_2064 [Bacteroidota bacterium]|jgi:hypothetical protein
MRKSLSALVFILFSCCISAIEKDTLALKTTTQKKHNTVFSSLSIGAATTSLVGLNSLWYKDYPQSNFHFFNDSKEWMQMDKCGHAFTSYQIGRNFYNSLQTSDSNRNKNIFLGGASGLIYLTGVEILDGKSAQWGFSNSDMIANTLGYFLFASQEYFLQEQFISLKFSYQKSAFADVRPETFGRNFQQRLLKDYNGQTYWLSAPLSLNRSNTKRFTRWLCISFGYSIDENLYADNNINSVNNFHATREFFFSFDADLNRIEWRRKWMKKIASVINFIKIPSPTIGIRSDGKVKVYPVYF